ncbi:MAG: MFS transporter [Chloroflexi bacterium]|nr:MFS transporter [Chloroflexota bacterium]
MLSNVRPDERTGSQLALVLATAGFTLCFAVWGLISPLAPVFARQYGLNGTQTGLLVAVPVILGSLARIPMGILTDRYGARIVFSGLLLFLILPTIGAGFADSYLWLLFWGFWLGFAGSSFAIGVPLVARWYPPSRHGFALGIYGVGNIGTTVALLTAPRLSVAYGPGAPFWVFVPLLAALGVVFWLIGREPPWFVGKGKTVGQLAQFLAEHPLAWILSLFYFITFGGFVALSLYLPTLLTSVYKLDTADAAFRAAVFVVVATVARPLGGYLSDRWGAVRVLLATFTLVAALAVALAFGPGLAAAMVVYLSCAFLLGAGNGAVFKLVPSYFGSDTGVVTGLVGAAGGLGGFFPPILMGLVHDLTGSYAIGFMLLSEFALVALAVTVLVLTGVGESLRRSGR